MSKININVENHLPILDFSHLDQVSAYHALGKAVGIQARKILKRKMRKEHDTLARARYLHQSIIAKINDIGIHQKIRFSISDYLACVQSWAEGAKLNHPAFTSLELGLLLQDDNSGCQTGFFRERSGAVAFWHTEEDIDELHFRRVDQPRLMRYKTANGLVIHSFIYPDLLPGSTFNWRSDGHVQLVDALLLKDDLPKIGLPANLFAWLNLHVYPEISLDHLFSALQPFFDGYALFSAGVINDVVDVKRIEFCQDDKLLVELGQNPGNSLIQVNIFSNENQPMAKKYERHPFRDRTHYEQRIQRAQQILQGILRTDDAQAVVGRMLFSKEGGQYAFNNKDVKAFLYGRISTGGLNIYAAPGCGV